MRQPDDPGPDPMAPPHPFDRIASSLRIKVYLFLIVLVIVGTSVAYVVRA